MRGSFGREGRKDGPEDQELAFVSRRPDKDQKKKQQQPAPPFPIDQPNSKPNHRMICNNKERVNLIYTLVLNYFRWEGMETEN